MALDRYIAFIGAGNMATALIEGLVGAGTCRADHLLASDPRSDTLASLEAKLGIRTGSDNTAIAARADVLVLATKPQVLPAVLEELAPGIGDPLVVSIAAGVPTEVIERALGERLRVVRAMPNTPALVRAGATALAAGRFAGDDDLGLAEQLFASVGITVRVPETMMDAVTGLSGSGPAYVFAMIEALSAAGERVGLSREAATRLSAQTVYGAAKLLHDTGDEAAALRAKVTSPGGTTQAGLERLAERGFAEVVADAVGRATERAHELGAAAKK